MNLTANQIIRNIKLYILSNITLDENIENLYNYLTETFENLNIYEEVARYGIVNVTLYYGKDKDNIIMRFFPHDGYVWIETNIFRKFEVDYNLEHKDVKDIILWYLTEYLVINEQPSNIVQINMEYLLKDIKLKQK